MADMTAQPVTQPIPSALLSSPAFQFERLRRRTRSEVESQLSKTGYTLREYWVMACLTEANAASQSCLSDVLGIDASDMVRLIDILEQRGWARRDRDPNDRRRQVVSATIKGRRATADLARNVSAAEAQALRNADDEQLTNLCQLVTLILSPKNHEAEGEATA